MIATAPPAATTPGPAPDITPGPAPDITKKPSPEDRGKLVVRWLVGMVLRGRPRTAIAAFNALVGLNEYYRETHARLIELSLSGRPAVAAAAVKALVRARRAYKRYQDGRGRLL
jgi:hypothetical protein